MTEHANPNPESMEAALRLIAGDCERIFKGCCSTEPNWSPYALYGADQWCDPCIARAGLAGTLPDPSSWTEPTEY